MILTVHGILTQSQPNSVRRWNVLPYVYDGHLGYVHVAGRRFENGLSFQTHQLPFDDNVDTIWRLFADTTKQTRQKNCGDKICSWICHGKLRFCLLVRIGP